MAETRRMRKKKIASVISSTITKSVYSAQVLDQLSGASVDLSAVGSGVVDNFALVQSAITTIPGRPTVFIQINFHLKFHHQCCTYV